MSSIETLNIFFSRSIEATLNCKQRHSVNDAKHPKPEPTVKKKPRSLDPRISTLICTIQSKEKQFNACATCKQSVPTAGFQTIYRLLVKRSVNRHFCTSYYHFVCRWHLQIKTAAKHFFLSWRICNLLDVELAGLQVASQFHEVLRIQKKWEKECYISVCSTINCCLLKGSLGPYLYSALCRTFSI